MFWISIKHSAFSVKCLNLFSWNLKINPCQHTCCFIPRMIYNFQIKKKNKNQKQKGRSTDLHSRTTESSPRSILQPYSQFVFLPDAEMCRMTSRFSLISSLNAFWVVVIFIRYFSVDYAIWKRTIAFLRLTSLLIKLKLLGPCLSLFIYYTNISFVRPYNLECGTKILQCHVE